ncbi:hypothetical protein O0Q50_22120 [Priestia aryabhattai]|uniref:Uncharacterized protein n=1 Tax=Priestia aryabhattai TaxID=412384 RepID=A0AAX6NDZ9_PRIAR|nr:hypothetical protein [Priestia aryabhattai]MDU9693880.1 hypothetical protein [Priestia aryabhattai]
MEYLAVILILLGGLAILVGLVTLAIPKTRKKGRVITASAIVVTLIGAVMINFADSSDSDDKASEEVSADTEEPEETEEEQANITKEQYENVQMGATQDQIKKDLGEVTEDNIVQSKGRTMWSYSDDNFGLAYIYFSNKDKKVVLKSELGLLSEDSNTETSKDGTVDLNDWKVQVKDIAGSDKSETEKFDEVSKLAMEYSLTDQELKEFEDSIVNEYKTNNYLKDIHNDEYMLTNIFKSTAIDEHYSSSTPIKEFAFDFLQNTKYTYRGAEVVGSQFVLANEDQMNDSLALMK